MIELDSRGYIIPYRPVNSTLDEVSALFVYNEKRKDLWESYLGYLDELRQVVKCPFVQWMNGSFVTKARDKMYPNDIDVISFLPNSVYDMLDNRKGSVLKNFRYPLSLDTYQVDGYIVKVYPETHRFYPLTEGDTFDWLHRFSRTKTNKRGVKQEKGFVELTFDPDGSEDK